MRAQASMTVVVPADHLQTAAALNATATVPGPIYFRLGKDDTKVVAGLDGAFEVGRLQRIREGRDAALIAMGPIAGEAVAAAALLASQGLHSSVPLLSRVPPAPPHTLPL